MLKNKIAFILSLLIVGSNVNIVNAKEYSKERISGKNRYETSYKISNSFDKENIKGVILASGKGFADALSGSALSKKYNAPIFLMSNNDEDDKATIDFLKNLDKSIKVYILGGEGSINKKTENIVKGIGFNVVRLGGQNRYETSYKISNEFNMENSKPVIIASGEGFADALSISSIASIKEYPILLTSKNQLSKDMEEKIKKIRPSEIFIIGGEGSINKNIENKLSKLSKKITRIGGKNRYETSQKIIEYFKLKGENIVLASGEGFADALSGSALAAKKNAPILLINKGSYKAQKKYIEDKTEYNKLIFLGGEGSISKEIYSFFSSNSKIEDDNIIKDESLKVADKMGNTNANYALYGALVPGEKDEYYFWNTSKIYSIHKNGDISKKIKSGKAKEYSYYNEKLYSGRYNVTTGEKILNEKKVKKIKIYNDYIYYIENLKNIKRITLDGKKVENIFKSKYSINNFFIYGDRIYFSGYEGKYLKTYSVSTKNLNDKKEVISNRVKFKMKLDYVSNNKVYFTDVSNSLKRSLYKSNLDGSNVEKIHDNLPGNIVVIDGCIYNFWDQIGKFNEKTKKYQILYKGKDIDISTVGFTNNKIIFSNLYDFNNINIMNLDGSNLEKIDLTTI